MVIKILGSGCPNCKKLEANAKIAVESLNLEASFEKITDFDKMMAYGIMSTPALVIDEKVVASGRVLSPQDIEKLIK